MTGLQVIHGNGPTAVKSRLGYLLSVPLLQSSATVSLVHVTFTYVDDRNIDTFWKAEFSGISLDTTANDNIFLNAYMQSLLNINQKFPRKEEHPYLPSNFSVHAKYTRSLVQRLAKTPELLCIYGQIIVEQEAKGFIEKVDQFLHHSGTLYSPSGCQKGLGQHTYPHSI